MTIREKVIEEIMAEREYQDHKWGGENHDDEHTWHDWVTYLIKHMSRAVVFPFNFETFHYQMVRVAALAVAAAEWSERKAK